MIEVYIFVQSPYDAEFLRRILLPESLKYAGIVAAGGHSGIASLAPSVLVARRKPIAIVFDAGSTNPDVIEERRESTEELMHMYAGSTPVKVIAVVPEIEAWLFAAPEVIARALAGPVPSDDMVFLGKRDPKGVLQLLAEKNNTTWDSTRALGLLDTYDIDRIRRLPEVNELDAFLKKVQTGDKAA